MNDGPAGRSARTRPPAQAAERAATARARANEAVRRVGAMGGGSAPSDARMGWRPAQWRGDHRDAAGGAVDRAVARIRVAPGGSPDLRAPPPRRPRRAAGPRHVHDEDQRAPLYAATSKARVCWIAPCPGRRRAPSTWSRRASTRGCAPSVELATSASAPTSSDWSAPSPGSGSPSSTTEQRSFAPSTRSPTTRRACSTVKPG